MRYELLLLLLLQCALVLSLSAALPLRCQCVRLSFWLSRTLLTVCFRSMKFTA